MKMRSVLFGLSLLFSLHGFAQSADTIQKGFVNIPFSISLELPGVYFMNYQDLNTSDRVVASLYNTDYMPGLNFNFGPRDRYYVSLGISWRSYQKIANYTFYSTQVNNQILASAPVHVVQRKYCATFYKSLVSRTRSTLYGFAGWQGSRTTIYGWRHDPDSYSGITNANFQVRQDWNVDFGFMYDFLRSQIFDYNFSLAVRAGYSIPLSKTKWVNQAGPMERLEKSNAGGFHAGILVNLL